MDIKAIYKEIKDGNVNSFELIIKEYQYKVFRYCYFMIGNKQEAEDAVQEVFIKAFVQFESYHYDDSYLAWLYKISSNHCKNIIKRKHKLKFLLSMLSINHHMKSAEQEFSDNKGVLMLLDFLSPGEREITVLRIVDDLSYDEISEILGVSSATIRKRFERIKKRIKRKSNELLGVVCSET